MMTREELLDRAARLAYGDPCEAWPAVIDRAEGVAHARVPGSLRHLEDMPALPEHLPITAAAVLVPIVDRPDGLHLLLTRRTAHLSAHAGQISFPGGRIDEGDRSPCDTALRETQEEIGLAPERVRVLGRLDNYLVGTGFRITPVLGLIEPPVTLALDANEVDEVFEVPLDFVLDDGNYQRDGRLINNVERQFNVLIYGDYYIWGATATILVNLRRALGIP